MIARLMNIAQPIEKKALTNICSTCNTHTSHNHVFFFTSNQIKDDFFKYKIQTMTVFKELRSD